MFKKITKYILFTFLSILLLMFLFIVFGVYFPTNVKGEVIKPKLFSLERDSLIDNKDLKLHVFNTGINKVSRLLVGSVNPWRPVPAFVIEHPKQGLIVFDSGLSSEIVHKGNKVLHPVTRFLFDTKSKKGKDLPSQMKSADMNPEKVTHVIFSHLHFDHIGNSDAFINATFYIGEDTKLSELTKIDGFEPEFLKKLELKHKLNKISFLNAKPYATYKETIDLFHDGTILVVRANGHVDGSIALIVNLPKGKVLLSGDEIVHFDWLNSNDVQHIATNKEQAASFRNRTRMLRKLMPEILIFPGHDFPNLTNQREDIILHQKEWFANKLWLR